MDPMHCCSCIVINNASEEFYLMREKKRKVMEKTFIIRKLNTMFLLTFHQPSIPTYRMPEVDTYEIIRKCNKRNIRSTFTLQAYTFCR